MKIRLDICLFCCFMLYGCGNSQQYIGKQYIGKQYINNPLGEEKNPDFDPLIRYDAFDCVTFVETSLAESDKEKLIKIRYKNGDVDFLQRNHFIETDWLINNSDIVENVSRQYGKTSFRKVVIDKKSWFKKNYNKNTNFKPEMVNLEYIPYSELTHLLTEKTLIVLFISGNSNFYDKIGTDLAVTHMGFLLPDGKLRHASSKYGCVMDVDFEQYIDWHKRNKDNIGIALVEIK